MGGFLLQKYAADYDVHNKMILVAGSNDNLMIDKSWEQTAGIILENVT